MALFDAITQATLKSSPTINDLIKREAKVGSQVFGPVPKGHRREFFCLDSHTWIWFEEWLDANGKKQSMTTRYEISKRGVLKVQDGRQYQYVRGQEAETFMQAISKYYQLVSRNVYGVTV